MEGRKLLVAWPSVWLWEMAATLVEAEWPASVLACVGHIRAVGPARDAPRDAALRLSCCPAVSEPQDP